MNLLLIWIACGIPGVLAAETPGSAAADATFEVMENSPEGTLVGTVPQPPDAVRFELLTEDENLPFTVDATTGGIAVRDSAAIDFETRRTFTFSVRVTLKPAEKDEDPLWKSFAERLGPDGGDELLAPRETVIERRIDVQLIDVEEPVSDPQQTPGETEPEAIPTETRPAVVKIIGPAVEAPRPSFPVRDTGSEPAVAGTPEPVVPGSIEPAAAAPVDAPLPAASDPALAGPADPGQTGGPVLLLPGDPRPAPSDEPDELTSAAGPDHREHPAPAVTPARKPAPGNRAFWPVLMGLLVLVGVAAHVLRVRALQRRWARAHRRDAGRAEAEADREVLAAAAQELREQRQALAEDCAKLAEDRARLAEDQQQLEYDREDLLAREGRLAAAEAQLADERAELERARQQLESELMRLQQHHEQARGSGRMESEDVYAVDDDERPVPPSGQGDPGASTWIDSSGLDSVEQDAEFDALRANLAATFGELPDPSAGGPADDVLRRSSAPEESQPPAPVVQWNPTAGSRDSLYRRTPANRPDESTGAGPAEGDQDSINSYMEALMKRLRQNGADPQNYRALGASSQPGPGESSGSQPWGITQAPVAQNSAAHPNSGPAADGSDAPPERRSASRPRPDKTSLRDTVNSLREVANISARSAVATYVRRKRTRRGLLIGLSYVALLAFATALLGGMLGAPIVDTAQPWLVLGMGAVVLVYYFWSVCLADRRRASTDWKFVAQPRRELTDDGDSPEAVVQSVTEQRQSATRTPRPGTGAVRDDSAGMEPVKETVYVASAR